MNDRKIRLEHTPGGPPALDEALGRAAESIEGGGAFTTTGGAETRRVRRRHVYRTDLTWTGNRGQGTRSYTAYARDFEVSHGEKPVLAGSSDPLFRGDPRRWSPEDLFVAGLSSCHQLWYLHLCADHGVEVISYEDAAEGALDEHADGSGEFTAVILRPRVTIAASSDEALALALHDDAHRLCFLARSVRCSVRVEARIVRAG